jgi:hypothetical protein
VSDGGTVYLATTGKTDTDVAAEFKAELRPLLDKIAAMQNRAAQLGLQLGFQFARDQFGRSFVQSVDVVKPL